MKLWKRLRLWTKRRQFERDLADEVRFHREMAGAAFGSEALALEESRAVWGLAWLDSWHQDIRYALRGFRKAPGFALGVIGAIALGLGLNTTMFTVFNAYALRPYAVQDPYALYEFNWYGKKGNGRGFSWERYAAIQKQKGVFSDVLASMNLASQVDGRNLFGQTVSGNYFTMLGVAMAYGRPLRPDDSGPVIVISYDAWRNKFASDPGLLGRKVYVRGQPFEVVGITNPAFAGLESFPSGFWIPLSVAGTIIDGRDLLGRQDEPLSLIGRLEHGIRPEAAKSAVLAWVRGFAPDAVGVTMQSRATTVPVTRDALMTFIPIFTAFGLVLLIACANVSNMMLARALARQREIAIRVSLGAGRARLIRQLLTESALLAIPAALAGLLISVITIEGAQRLLFATLPPAFARIMTLPDLAPDWRVFGFILLASLVTALLFGMAPAIQTTRSRLVEANRGDFSSDHRPARLRSLLVVAQVAVCTLLLISTAIVLRSEQRMTTQNIGLATQGVWDLRMTERHQAKAAARLAGSSGVGPIAAAWHAPLYGWLRHMPVSPSGSSQSVLAGYNFVSPGYFEIFRIPIVRGRIYSEREADSGAPVVVISQAAARKFWPRGDALGKTIAIPPHAHEDPSMDRSPAYTKAIVIGVVRDAMSGSVGNGIDDSCLYFPTKFGEIGNDSILVRMTDDGGNSRRRLEAILEQVAPSLSDFINPMSDVLAVQIYPFRVIFWVAGFLGGVALLMTISGIYGVMSYLVSQRRKEIGIRVALGAGARDVVWMVVRQSTRLAAIGTALGGGFALMVAPVFAHQLEVIQPYELSPYAISIALVLAAAMAAAFSPSRRAVGIDPVQTLRCD